MQASSIDPLAVSRATLQAYVDKDRQALEKLLQPDFHFTSPLDNRLDRKTYFERCWPNSQFMEEATIVEAAVSGEKVFFVYEVRTKDKRFRNVELHTVRGGKVAAVEVYFGWDLPHPAVPGSWIDEPK